MVEPSWVDVILGPIIVLATLPVLFLMTRTVWRDWRSLQELRLRESLLPRRKPRRVAPAVSDDAEDTRRLIAEARRVKEEFDRVEHLHDILARQRYGNY